MSARLVNRNKPRMRNRRLGKTTNASSARRTAFARALPPSSMNAPGVFNMLQQVRSAAPGDGDSVEAILLRSRRVHAHPCTRNVSDLAAFRPRDGIECVAPTAASACLHLDERDRRAAASDNIDF